MVARLQVVPGPQGEEKIWPAMNTIRTAATSLGSKSISRKPASGDTSAPRVRMNEDFRQVCVVVLSLLRRWCEDYNRIQPSSSEGVPRRGGSLRSRT